MTYFSRKYKFFNPMTYGDVTAEEVVRTFIVRSHEVNVVINSVVDDRFLAAIEDARIQDKFIQSGYYDSNELRSKYPLLGIPFTIKDAFAVKGLRQTAGLYSRKDIRSVEDADVVKILKEAGAIPLGVTNVSELCMWWESVNSIYGRSKNPYDTRHTVGGSSGGEAGLQAAAGSGFGIGSDVGGSIRMPAFFCGVFGHKPTVGLVSCVGQEPKAGGRIRDFLSVGVLVRHSEDLKLLFRVMVDENFKELKPPPPLKSIRLFYMEDDGGSPLVTPVSEELKVAMRKAIKFLELKHDLKAQRIKLEKLYHSLEIWANGMSGAGSTTFCDELGMKQRKVNPFWELLKLSLGLSNHTFPALVLGVFEKVAYLTNHLPIHKKMVENGYSLSRELQDLLRDDGVLVYPSHPTTAPQHNRPIFRLFDFSYAAVFNILGLPVTQVPLGISESGLPLGVQIVASRFNDLLLMSLAEELETGFGGWVPP